VGSAQSPHPPNSTTRIHACTHPQRTQALTAIGLSGTIAVSGAALCGIDLSGQFHWERAADLQLALQFQLPLLLLEAALFLPAYSIPGSMLEAQQPQQQQQQLQQQPQQQQQRFLDVAALGKLSVWGADSWRLMLAMLGEVMRRRQRQQQRVQQARPQQQRLKQQQAPLQPQLPLPVCVCVACAARQAALCTRLPAEPCGASGIAMRMCMRMGTRSASVASLPVRCPRQRHTRPLTDAAGDAPTHPPATGRPRSGCWPGASTQRSCCSGASSSPAWQAGSQTACMRLTWAPLPPTGCCCCRGACR
jgi:hypothetical protein